MNEQSWINDKCDRKELLDMLEKLEKRHAYWTSHRIHRREVTEVMTFNYSQEYMILMLSLSRRDINRIRNQLEMELI